MSLLRSILSDLREKRLWPVAAALVIALVAVPVLLPSNVKPAPVAQLPQPAVPVNPLSALPAVSIQTTPTLSKLTGPARDPFTQPRLPSPTGTGNASSPSSSTASKASSTGTTASSGSSTTPTTPTTPPPIIPPTSKPKPAPSGLTSTQAYDVALSISTSAGGVAPIDPLKRLSPLPNDQQPLLVELGVLQGGNRVLFAVQPGTVVNGPGSCTPGPIDCEILSLGQDQTESISSQGPGGLSQVALFAVTRITATNYPSTAAANDARRVVSPAGRAVLHNSTLPTLSLFPYEPSLGVVVDQRDLTVGG